MKKKYRGAVVEKAAGMQEVSGWILSPFPRSKLWNNASAARRFMLDLPLETQN